MKNIFLVNSSSSDYRDWPKNHPLGRDTHAAWSRTRLGMDRCKNFGPYNTNNNCVVEVPWEAASAADLQRYICQVHSEELFCHIQSGTPNADLGLGTDSVPMFQNLAKRAMGSCWAGKVATDLIAQGGVAFHVTGGGHHAYPKPELEPASPRPKDIGPRVESHGFCPFNDVALSVLNLLQKPGIQKVFVLDLDAHPGDGTERIFEENHNVFTCSVHEKVFKGFIIRKPRHTTTARNFILPTGSDDTALDYVMDKGVLKLIKEFGPDAIVMVHGADGLYNDNGSQLEYSERGLVRNLEKIVKLVPDVCPRLMVTLGGGYNPMATANHIAATWRVLNRLPVTEPDLLGESFPLRSDVSSHIKSVVAHACARHPVEIVSKRGGALPAIKKYLASQRIRTCAG